MLKPFPELERTKLRSLLLHTAIAEKIEHFDEDSWAKMNRNLARVRANTRGNYHQKNIRRWQEIIDNRDIVGLRTALTDPTDTGIRMRETSPMSGFISNPQRLTILKTIKRV